MKRLFRGLRRKPPAQRYDAVVVGAGIGGLYCANLLAREGLSVLLCEQHYMVGGYCSTFRRAGFTFDAATHFYPLLGNAETLTGKLTRKLGVETQWHRMDPVDSFHLPDGSRFDVAADLEPYMASLKDLFPHEAEALDRFFAEVNQAYLLGLLAYFRDRETPTFERLRDQTLDEALDRHFGDPKLKLLLAADCPHWGSPPGRTSFVFDSMLRLSYFLGNYYPAGGSQAFADELARRFEEHGGEILMSAQARRIPIRDGRAAGVEVEVCRGPLSGRYSVAADAVISNADLRLTMEEMVGAEYVGETYLDELRGLRPSYPCFLSHIGVQGVDPGELERAQGYYWRHWDAERVGKDGLICKIFVPTQYEPALAPPGGQVVLLQKVLAMDYDGTDDWELHRRRIEKEVTDHLEAVLPGIRRRIVVQTSATAKTSWRFTLNRHGAMLGWEMSPEQLGRRRPGIETPIDGLYLVGHWTRPGGGITPVIVSAMQASERILRGGGQARGPRLAAGARAVPDAPLDLAAQPGWI